MNDQLRVSSTDFPGDTNTGAATACASSYPGHTYAAESSGYSDAQFSRDSYPCSTAARSAVNPGHSHVAKFAWNTRVVIPGDTNTNTTATCSASDTSDTGAILPVGLRK
jgi:hypothetical protein